MSFVWCDESDELEVLRELPRQKWYKPSETRHSESKQKRAAIALGLLEMMDSEYERAAAGLSVYDHEKIHDWG